ncbi:MAG: GlgB N-terminal domain-containing protein, partial [Mycobacteriales bacterium]
MSPKTPVKDDLSVTLPSGPTDDELERLAGGAHHDPHGLLGMHPAGKGSVIRSLRPGAEKVVAKVDGTEVPL